MFLSWSFRFLNPLLSDTLLNVFLAIAVDNLANAQELTKVLDHIIPYFTSPGYNLSITVHNLAITVHNLAMTVWVK